MFECNVFNIDLAKCTKYKQKTLYIKGGKDATIAVIETNIVIEYAYMNEN